MPSRNIKFAFDFYGCGNIGDDLMLHGFMQHWPAELACFGAVSSFQAQVLGRRFEQIDWRSGSNVDPHTVWLGVGDTPIQILSGDFLLRFLERELLVEEPSAKLRVLLGAGVEQEATSELQRFRRVLNKVDLIWTRDEYSRDTLVNRFAFSASRVKIAADLANVALAQLAPVTAAYPRPIALGVNFYCERLHRRTLAPLVTFVNEEAKRRKVVWLANEVRSFRNSEVWLYRRLRSWLTPFTGWNELELVAPTNYSTSVGAMVEHFGAIETVLSSRYHCLLAAAWFGCRVAGIARSSKIRRLCCELDIPFVEVPFSGRALMKVTESACRVPRSRLNMLAEAARLCLLEAASVVGHVS